MGGGHRGLKEKPFEIMYGMDVNLGSNNSSNKKQNTLEKREMIISEVNEAYNNEIGGYGALKGGLSGPKILSRASTSLKPMNQTFSKQLNSSKLRNSQTGRVGHETVEVIENSQQEYNTAQPETIDKQLTGLNRSQSQAKQDTTLLEKMVEKSIKSNRYRQNVKTAEGSRSGFASNRPERTSVKKVFN